MNAIQFGKHLKNLRLQKELTLSELGEMVGLSHSYLSQIENGKKGIPSPDLLKKISEPLGQSFTLLMKNAGYLEIPSGSDWENITDFIGNVVSSKDGDNYKKILMAMFEILEFFYNNHHVTDELITTLEEEAHKLNISVNKDHFKDFTFAAFKELMSRITNLTYGRKLLSEVMKLDEWLDKGSITYKNVELSNSDKKLLELYLDTLLKDKMGDK